MTVKQKNKERIRRFRRAFFNESLTLSDSEILALLQEDVVIKTYIDRKIANSVRFASQDAYAVGGQP